LCMNNIDRGVEVSIPFYNEHISQDIINEIMLLIKYLFDQKVHRTKT
jgi:hypothetical protein